MIDRFAAKSSGLPSGDEESSEDSHPKRRERKTTLRSPRRNVPNAKRTSSSSSEISEKEVEKAKTLKRKTPPTTLSSSEDSDGESKPKKEKMSVVEKHVNVDKGKTLLGKKKIIKRGVPKKLPLKQPNKPNTTLSSDSEENCALNDTKDSSTNYLGLNLKSDSEDKNVKVDNNLKVESDDDIQCIKEIKVSPNGSLNNYSNSFVKSKSLILPRIPSKKSTETIGSNKKSPNSEVTKDILKIDDDSDTEPVNLKEEALKRNAGTIKMLKDVSHKRSKRFSSNSNTDVNRTSSDEESEKNKILSDLELSGDTKELSSSCDSENAKVTVAKGSKTPSGADDAVIVINEESEASNPLTNKRILSESSQDSFDSDEVTILCKYQFLYIISI